MDFFLQSYAVFAKGGAVMYPLFICSVLVVAVAIERCRCFRQSYTDVDALLERLEPKLKAGDWHGAAALCRGEGGAVAGVLARGLALADSGRAQMEGTMESYAALAVAGLRRRLSYLDTIVTLAPLLGLLGTVSGMIRSFSVLSLQAGQPLAITGGVGEALVATGAGLCIAIVALVAHSYFNQRVDTTITDMETAAVYVLDAVGRSVTYETD